MRHSVKMALYVLCVLAWDSDCYVLDGPGIEFRLGRDFPHASRPALGPTQPPLK